MNNYENNEFYEKYLKQLEEPAVRKTHDKMFGAFYNVSDLTDIYVIDLGCGTCEFERYGEHDLYLGFDLNDNSRFLANKWMDSHCFQKNFIEEMDDILSFRWDVYSPNVFVSLFATEIYLPTTAKYNLYRKIFRESSIEAGLVAGFYYKDKMYDFSGLDPVEKIIEDIPEVGQFEVYQTVENQYDHIYPEFTEFRSYHNVTSEMFGELVEVWKIFLRNP